MTKKEATFIFPGGQEYTHTLATHISPAILYNLFYIYNPTLAAACAGIDFLSGAGRTFEDRTLRLNDTKTNKKVFIDIEKIRKKPEHYILVSGGLGYGLIRRSEEINQIYIAETYFELIRSHRDVIHYGLGLNPGYFKEKHRAGVKKVSTYFLFKVAPRIDKSPRRIYFIGHAGAGTFWTTFDEGEEWSYSYFYFALGLGMEFNEKIYSELLLNGYWNDCIKFPDSSLGFHIGYRLDLF